MASILSGSQWVKYVTLIYCRLRGKFDSLLLLQFYHYNYTYRNGYIENKYTV